MSKLSAIHYGYNLLINLNYIKTIDITQFNNAIIFLKNKYNITNIRDIKIMR